MAPFLLFSKSNAFHEAGLQPGHGRSVFCPGRLIGLHPECLLAVLYYVSIGRFWQVHVSTLYMLEKKWNQIVIWMPLYINVKCLYYLDFGQPYCSIVSFFFFPIFPFEDILYVYAWISDKTSKNSMWNSLPFSRHMWFCPAVLFICIDFLYYVTLSIFNLGCMWQVQCKI